MKDKEKKGGYVLVVALVATMALGMVASGLVRLTLQERRLAARSSAYSRALYAAESGTDLACEEFSKQSAGESAWSGWASSGAFKSSSSNLTGGAQFSVTASNSADLCIITSTGTVSVAGVTVQRVVKVAVQRVQNTPQFFKYGMMSFGPISMGGSVSVNSFDSTDSTKSTNGQYDPAKATYNATVATLSTNNPAISVSGGVNLSGISCFSVRAGSRVNIAHYIPYTGSITYDASQDIQEAAVPVTASPTGAVLVGPWPNQAQTITINGAQDISLPSLTVSQSGNLTVTGSGTLRIYVAGNTAISGSARLSIVPSPSTADLKVELYANGSVSIGGSGVINNTYRASSFSLWGTENCTSISVTGNSRYIGTIYAPHATVNLTGSSGATGAFLGKSITFTGSSGYVIDESLIGSSSPSSPSSGSGKPYRLVSWGEL